VQLTVEALATFGGGTLSKTKLSLNFTTNALSGSVS
jgi:hypothetical protein